MDKYDLIEAITSQGVATNEEIEDAITMYGFDTWTLRGLIEMKTGKRYLKGENDDDEIDE